MSCSRCSTKSGILNIIEALELPYESVYPIFIAACPDRFCVLYSHESVLKKGEDLLKKNASRVNLEDLNLISRLFLLFNGMEHVLERIFGFLLETCWSDIFLVDYINL